MSWSVSSGFHILLCGHTCLCICSAQHNRINYSHFVVSLIQVACSTASFANLTIYVRNCFLSLCMMSVPSVSKSDLSTTANSHLLIDPHVCNQDLSEHRTQEGIYAWGLYVLDNDFVIHLDHRQRNKSRPPTPGYSLLFLIPISRKWENELWSLKYPGAEVVTRSSSPQESTD